MRAAPAALTGLLGLIAVEILKWAAPFLFTWLVAALLIGLKVGFAITLVIITFFVLRSIKQRRDHA